MLKAKILVARDMTESGDAIPTHDIAVEEWDLSPVELAALLTLPLRASDLLLASGPPIPNRTEIPERFHTREIHGTHRPLVSFMRVVAWWDPLLVDQTVHVIQTMPRVQYERLCKEAAGAHEADRG